MASLKVTKVTKAAKRILSGESASTVFGGNRWVISEMRAVAAALDAKLALDLASECLELANEAARCDSAAWNNG